MLVARLAGRLPGTLARLPTALLLVVVNLLPVWGVMTERIGMGDVFLIYWIENVALDGWEHGENVDDQVTAVAVLCVLKTLVDLGFPRLAAPFAPGRSPGRGVVRRAGVLTRDERPVEE